jgi:nitroreductase
MATLIRSRRSVRSFSDKPVQPATVKELIELATWAPSASNRQDWFFTVVYAESTKREMARAVREHWDDIVAANEGSGLAEEVRRYSAQFAAFETAPVVIALSARTPDSAQKHLLGDVARATVGSAASAAMAVQNLMLASHARGLATCCMTGPVAAREELSNILELGKREEIICLVTLGWPAESPDAPPRKPVEQVMRIVE